jgi:hypothetical protein
MEAMTQNKNRERRPLDRLANLLADDIFATPDEEILAEFREAGGNPDRNAAEMRALFEKSVVIGNKRRLAAAKAGVAASKRSKTAYASVTIDIAAARRKLREVLKQDNVPQGLMLAARKEDELSDADVLAMIENLRELGLLPHDDEGEGP